MRKLKKCPVCGGELIEKTVEKLLRGGENTAVMYALAEVCLHCGERLYPQNTIKQFEQVRHKLEHKDISTFKRIGQTYALAA
jgi:YgiT-type zinc finger domain-containing protein